MLQKGQDPCSRLFVEWKVIPDFPESDYQSSPQKASSILYNFVQNVQLQIVDSDLSAHTTLTASRIGSLPNIKAPAELHKDDILIVPFIVSSDEAQALDTAGEVVIRWRRHG